MELSEMNSPSKQTGPSQLSSSSQTGGPRVAAVRKMCVVVGWVAGIAAGLLSTGCVAVVAGAGAGAAVAYVRGDLDATVNASMEKAVKAANAALGDLKFAKVSENKDALQAILVARTAADKRVEIRVEKIGDSVAKVKIRVGVFGDETLSLAILEKLKANL